MEVTRGKQMETGRNRGNSEKGLRLIIHCRVIVSFLTSEKERRVKELLEQHKSTRDIAKELHISFKDIGAIRRKIFGETETQANNEVKPTLSTDSRVFQMFEEGKTPVEVTIQLDLNSDEVSRLYRKWWDLKGLELLNDLYQDIKEELFDFHSLYLQIKDEGLSVNKVIAAARCKEQLPFLERRLCSVQDELMNIESKKQHQLNELDLLQSKKIAAEKDLTSLVWLVDNHKQEISNLIDLIKRLERLVALLKSSRVYQAVQAIAEQRISEILEDNYSILVTALLGVIQALAKEPDLRILMTCSQTSPIYDPRSGVPPQNYVQLLQQHTLKLAQELQNKLLTKCLDDTMSVIDSLDYEPPYSTKELTYHNSIYFGS